MDNNNKTSENKIQKIAIVTGSSSGIGRTTAIGLAKEGIKVVIAAKAIVTWLCYMEYRLYRQVSIS